MLPTKTIGGLSIFLLAFSIVGFPIQSFIPFLLNVDSRPINLLFRIGFVGLSIALIFFSALKINNQKTRKGWLFFLGFWFLYSLRLIYDIEFQGLTYLDTDSFFVYSFAFGVCLVPSIAIYVTVPYLNHTQAVSAIFWTLLASNLCLCYALLSFGHWNLLEILTSRAWVNIEINGETKSLINPITIGFFGELLAILSIHLLNFPVYKNKRMVAVLYVSLILGFLNLALGASRGPMLFFVLLLFVEIYLILKKNKLSPQIIWKLSVWGGLVVVLLFFLITIYSQNEEIAVINRLFQTVEDQQDGGKEEREFLFESAIRQFTESPIIGDAFVTRYFYLFNSYSHNLFLDVLMSTGMIGFIVFGSMLFYVFHSCRHVLVAGLQTPLPVYVLLFLAHFLLSMTSGGLFMSSGLWILGALMLNLKY